MKLDHGRYPISLKNQLRKPLGPLLGVNQMWTKRNDHAPKSGRADLFIMYPKRAMLDFYLNNMSLPRVPPFF